MLLKGSPRLRRVQEDNVVRSSTNRRVRILCISPFFPPTVNSEAFCSGKMVKALLDAGLDISVLHCSNVNGSRPGRDESNFWRSLEDVSTDVVIPAVNNRLRTIALAARYRTHFYVRWIDAIVRRARELHAEQNFDVVYSRSLPTVAHLAGYWCATTLNLPWVANMNDPWDSFMVPGRGGDASPLYSAVSTQWLRRTLRKADLVMYPSERLHHYQGRITGIDRPAVILPHVGYSARAFDEFADVRSGAVFRLVHAGKLGSHEKPSRPAASLLIGLSAFLSAHPEARHMTRLTLVGPEDPETLTQIARLGIQSMVEVVGSVSYEESLRYIATAAVCLLVEARLEEGIFLPSKLVDYISARKPVLALSPRAGIVADLAADNAILRADPDDPRSVRDALEHLYEDFKRGTLHARNPTPELIAQFEPPVVAERFLTAIDRLLVRSGLRADPTKFSAHTVSAEKREALQRGQHAPTSQL